VLDQIIDHAAGGALIVQPLRRSEQTQLSLEPEVGHAVEE
jgi:hypothetical protein